MILGVLRFIITSLVLSLAAAENKPDVGPCENVTIVSRKQWRARPMEHSFEMYSPVNAVVIIHTASYSCSNKPSCVRNVQFTQNYHMDDKGWSDIGYNFLIGGDGRVYEGGGWTERGAHSINFNTNSVGIAFMGDFDKSPPSKMMLDAAQNLIKCGIMKGYLTPTCVIHGHRDVACTISPGQALYDIIKTWKNFRGGKINGYSCD